jgi:hypothetical protein
LVNSANYALPATYIPYSGIITSLTQTAATKQVVIPAKNTNSLRLYLRIGLPMDKNVSFSKIQAKFSTNS